MDGVDIKQEKIVQQQVKDKEDILQHMQTYEKQNAQRFDRVEKHLDITKKQLQKQGQQCTAMEASSTVMYNFGVGPRFAFVSASARAPK